MTRRLLAALLCCVSLTAWADSPDAADIPIPEGYVLQRLEETDGQIARPKDWFFASRGIPNGWMWTLSREDTSKGAYEAGVRIQMLLGVGERSGKTREAFVEDFLAAKRASTEVLHECPATDQGDFQRRCLEVIEQVAVPPQPMKPYRILYSMLWGEELDIVVVVIGGAPPEQWTEVAPMIDTMAQFRLIGPKFGNGVRAR